MQHSVSPSRPRHTEHEREAQAHTEVSTLSRPDPAAVFSYAEACTANGMIAT
jgi:hypothetical protein